jgi:DNA-binding response OmpR family regulator
VAQKLSLGGFAITIIDRPLLGAKVLVVEDDLILALDLIGILTWAGAEIIGPARSVKRAVELAGEADLDCGVLDVSLKDELVFPAAAVLERKKVNTIFYTGQIDQEAIRRDWPAATVLAKPAPIRTLLQALVEACGKA